MENKQINNKLIIHITIILVLLVISFVIFLVYYTQNFNSQVSIVNQISFSDIEIQTRQSGVQNTEYLTESKAYIGELILDNTEGIFTQVYSPDIYFGCLNFDKDKITTNSDLIRIYNYYPNSDQPIKGSYTSYSIPTKVNEIEVEKGESIKLSLWGFYTPYPNPDVSEFTRDSVNSITIYKIEQKADNPLSDYPTSYRSSTRSCGSLINQAELVTEIAIT